MLGVFGVFGCGAWVLECLGARVLGCLGVVAGVYCATKDERCMAGVVDSGTLNDA